MKREDFKRFMQLKTLMDLVFEFVIINRSNIESIHKEEGMNYGSY